MKKNKQTEIEKRAKEGDTKEKGGLKGEAIWFKTWRIEKIE